jgi:hypothetical protein
MTLPCRVTSIVSPCSTRLNMALGLWENSRTETELIDCPLSEVPTSRELHLRVCWDVTGCVAVRPGSMAMASCAALSADAWCRTGGSVFRRGHAGRHARRRQRQITDGGP